MVPDIQNLIELQHADREILRLKEEIAALPKRVATIEERLAGTRARLEKAKASVKADEAARRKYETAISDSQQKISKYRDQSLEVKTNEQYKALMHEIQFAEQEIRANEDKILELMMNSEAREKDVKAAEAELKAATAEVEKEKIQARERTAEDEKQTVEWNAKREVWRSRVNPDVLRQYDRVAKYRGSGISEVRDQKCMACQVMLRPQTYNEVRSDQLVTVNPASEFSTMIPVTITLRSRPGSAGHIRKWRPARLGITGQATGKRARCSWYSSTRVRNRAAEFTTRPADVRLAKPYFEKALTGWHFLRS